MILTAALRGEGRAALHAAAVLLAANLGDDADATAIAGQLAGALYGLDAIPSAWRERLAWRERIATAAAALVRAG